MGNGAGRNKCKFERVESSSAAFDLGMRVCMGPDDMATFRPMGVSLLPDTNNVQTLIEDGWIEFGSLPTGYRTVE